MEEIAGFIAEVRRRPLPLWSDIPNDRILKWDETTSAVSVFRHPSGNANGNARDRTGRLVTCERSARRVTRSEYDGSITVILDRFQGKRLAVDPLLPSRSVL
jgi:gluconolactonase